MPSAKKILVIDDCAEERRRLEKILGEAGYAVSQVIAGPKAIAEAVRVSPDLILLDYTYGDQLSGYLRKLLAEHETLGRIPMLLLSARADAVRRTHTGVASVVEVLAKPVVESLLLPAVEKAVGGPPPPPVDASPLARLADEIHGPPSEESEAGWDPETVDLKRASRTLAARLRERIGAGLRQAGDVGREELVRALASRVLDPGFLGELVRELHEHFHGCGKQGFTAEARTIAFSDLLQSLANGKATGILSVMGSQNLVEIQLQAGTICFLNPRKINLRYCQDKIYCSWRELPVDYVRSTLEKSRSEDDSIYFHMLADRLMEPDELPAFMVCLGLEVLRECVSNQESCHFQFRPRETLASQFLVFDAHLPPQRLLLKLFTHIDEWEQLQRAVQESIEFAPTGAEGIQEIPSEKQASILVALKEFHSILALSSACRLSAFEVYRGLQRLEQLGLVRRVAVGAC